MPISPTIWISLVISFIATCFIWRRIFADDGRWFVKTAYAIFAAIPFFGPMLYIFLVPPTKHPPEKRMRTFPKGTEVYPSFSPLIQSIARMFNAVCFWKKQHTTDMNSSKIESHKHE